MLRSWVHGSGCQKSGNKRQRTERRDERKKQKDRKRTNERRVRTRERDEAKPNHSLVLGRRGNISVADGASRRPVTEVDRDVFPHRGLRYQAQREAVTRRQGDEEPRRAGGVLTIGSYRCMLIGESRGPLPKHSALGRRRGHDATSDEGPEPSPPPATDPEDSAVNGRPTT